MQHLEVPCGGSFTDEDFHAVLDFVQRLVVGETFVVGGNTGVDVGDGGVAGQSGGMAVNGFPILAGESEFFHDYRVVK